MVFNSDLTVEERVRKAERIHKSIELVRGAPRQERLGRAGSEEP
jgi:hypothetical protein